MANRPQANGTAERMVQTLTREIKMYVTNGDQKDWDEYAERLTFAMNTAQDCVRGDTQFYWIHGWDPRIDVEATLLLRALKHAVSTLEDGDITSSVNIKEQERR